MTKEDRQATDDEAKSSACADSRHIVYSVATPPYYLPQQTTGAYVVDEFFHEVGRRLCLSMCAMICASSLLFGFGDTAWDTDMDTEMWTV